MVTIVVSIYKKVDQQETGNGVLWNNRDMGREVGKQIKPINSARLNRLSTYGWPISTMPLKACWPTIIMTNCMHSSNKQPPGLHWTNTQIYYDSVWCTHSHAIQYCTARGNCSVCKNLKLSKITLQLFFGDICYLYNRHYLPSSITLPYSLL